MKLQNLHLEILASCAYDDVGLWVIVRIVSEEEYFANKLPEWVRQKTLQIIRDLLEEGLIEAGKFHGMIYNTYSG